MRRKRSGRKSRSPEVTERKMIGSYGKPDKRKGNEVSCEPQIDHDSARNIKNDAEKPAQPETDRAWRF